MKMIRLMQLKQEREAELKSIEALRTELKEQMNEKAKEIENLDKQIILLEHRIIEIKELIKKLEAKQGAIKKVDEFKALSQEMTQAERERVNTEQQASDLIDKKNLEEEFLEKIKTSLTESEENSLNLEKEIKESIATINKEGLEIKKERDLLAEQADETILKIYNRLLKNKKDRVVVPIENRTCNGCHISLTAQHENLVRKGERLVFCEHCSRILYWLEGAEAEESETTPKRRRRRKTS